MFLLNNITHLRTRLLDDPRTDIPALLSRPSRDALNSAARTAKAAYFDSNFSPLMQALTDDPKDKGRSAAKEKATRFFDLLEEVSERHKAARVLSGEEQAEERETLAEEVVKLVVPSLNRFTQKHRDTFSKSKWRLLFAMSGASAHSLPCAADPQKCKFMF
jgi:exocyst complex component 7